MAGKPFFPAGDGDEGASHDGRGVSAAASRAAHTRHPAGYAVPKRRPRELEALEEAASLLADARYFSAKFHRLREEHLRRALGVVRPRVRAPATEHAGVEERAAKVGLAERLRSRQPFDDEDARFCASLRELDLREQAAQERAAKAFAVAAAAFGQREAERAVRRAPTSIERKNAFHHGDLREAAIREAVERMRAGGPLAVTIRGVARDLGVSGRAISFHFRNVEGFRAAVAEALIQQLAVFAHTAEARVRAHHPSYVTPERDRLPPRAKRGVTWTEEVAESWLDYAVENPALYKQLAGEGWHRPKLAEGIHPAGVVSPRMHLRSRAVERVRDKVSTERAEALADDLSIALHGLALARIDGASEAAVRSAVLRLVAAAPA